MTEIILSQKQKDFLRYRKASLEVLEGTTASGKTTISITKLFLRIAESNRRSHIIAGQSIGVVEKNIINKELGIMEQFAGYVEYNPRGQGVETMSHIRFHTPNGDKIIYIVGYSDISKWKQVLGGQYGCALIDEVNTANIDFVRQLRMRCDYTISTLNPDDNDMPIYKEMINRCRPIEKYENDAPDELLKCLDEPPEDGWAWWYFTFDDNKGLSEAKKAQIRSSHVVGSLDYKHYILGLRGKAQGVIFDNFNTKVHLLTQPEIYELAHNKGDKEHFIQYTAGLDTAYSSKSADTISMTFLGITNKKRLIYIDENVINNRDTKTPFAPSDVVKQFYEFLEENRKKYGFARDTFIDSADQATITEFAKLKRQKGIIYNFNPAHKSLKIIDRINYQKGWISTGHYYVCNTCKNHIKELQTYSWSERGNKAIPEDANDHTINSQQYAFIPFIKLIGS